MDINAVDEFVKTVWKIAASCRAFYLLFWKKDRDANDTETAFMWLAVSVAL